MERVYYSEMASPVGRLLLAGTEDGLRMLSFTMGPKAREADADWIRDDGPFHRVKEELEEYFSGARREFTVNLAPAGTDFQLRVWKALREIPYATTISYGELARRIGNAKGSRAVGLANGANPIAIIVPCHRVIGATGKLTGFGGGLDIKQRLLDLERGARLLG
ncbi:MAG: methylated-DNA--[protein]-cysteine S-methyltransferase [Bryobacterales bacterium]|nr:methylated-DNA--[protein]-cysteine S-methyltransferase [Bryobacterales bacterium]